MVANACISELIQLYELVLSTYQATVKLTFQGILFDPLSWSTVEGKLVFGF